MISDIVLSLLLLFKAAKRRQRLGYDPKTKDWIIALDDVEEIKLGIYTRNTLLNIIDMYKKKVAELEQENTDLKKRLDVIAKT